VPLGQLIELVHPADVQAVHMPPKALNTVQDTQEDAIGLVDT